MRDKKGSNRTWENEKDIYIWCTRDTFMEFKANIMKRKDEELVVKRPTCTADMLFTFLKKLYQMVVWLGLKIFSSMTKYARSVGKSKDVCDRRFTKYYGETNKIIAIKRIDKVGQEKLVGYIDTDTLKDFINTCDMLTE